MGYAVVILLAIGVGAVALALAFRRSRPAPSRAAAAGKPSKKQSKGRKRRRRAEAAGRHDDQRPFVESDPDGVDDDGPIVGTSSVYDTSYRHDPGSSPAEPEPRYVVEGVATGAIESVKEESPASPQSDTGAAYSDYGSSSYDSSSSSDSDGSSSSSDW